MSKFLDTFKSSIKTLCGAESRGLADRALGVAMVEDRIHEILELSEDGDPCMLSTKDIAELRALFSRAVSGAIDALNELADDAASGPVSARDLAERMSAIRADALRSAGIVD